MKIAMIMLAAGNSRRFGENKLLYEVDGMPMYRHVLKQLIKAKDQQADIRCDISVVTQYDMIAETARKQGIRVLYNLHPEQGISSSLKIGLEANLDADAVLFTVSDQPWLTGETISDLIRAFMESKKAAACVSYHKKMGNPCIFAEKYYNELLALEGDKGGKKVLMKHLEDICIYEVKDAKELEDIDYRK